MLKIQLKINNSFFKLIKNKKKYKKNYKKNTKKITKKIQKNCLKKIYFYAVWFF